MNIDAIRARHSSSKSPCPTASATGRKTGNTEVMSRAGRPHSSIY